MVDLEVLKSKGITSDRLKEIFTAEGKGKVKSKDFDVQTRVRNRIRDRINSGIQYNLHNYKYWHACDLAWDVPFRQTTYSLMKGFLDRGTPSKEILSALEGADLSEMIILYDKSGKVLSGRADPKDIAEVKVNAPTFFQIFIPLAKQYTTIRAAAIVNSYRQIPLLKYEAAKSTELNRVKSDIITDRVELMSTQYGYYDVIKQAVMHMLHYSVAILFPTEEWHSEPQTMRVPKEDADGKIIDGKFEEKEVNIKEGLRFNIPHPSRIFIDAAFRPSTINSDTGVMFGAYWRIARVGEVMTNPMYWNNDKIPYNGADLKRDNPAFFNTVYSSCAVKFGLPGTTDKGDRETRVIYYTLNEPDRAITFTEYFEKVNPKTEGIGDYDGQVWFRYVVAGTDTVVYAAPLAHCPMAYFGYDALETRAQNASMTLEILPFQDHISNLFTQYLLTIKQNLTNVTFFDTNQVDKKTIEDIQNLGQKHYTANNFQPMDMRTNRVGGNDVKAAFQTFQFPHQPTDALIQGVNELLKILERVLVISPQELAQTASHELTAEEVKNMNAAKSTRYEFSAGAVDRGVYALKSLIYASLMAYADEDLYARLPTPIDAGALDKLGFTVAHTDTNGKTALVTGKKTAILVDSFAANRDGDLRVANAQTAQSMTQVLQAILGNPQLFQEVGAKQVLNLINEICQIGGLPRDFRFASTGALENQQAQQMQALQKQLEQTSQAIEKKTVEDVSQQVGPVFQSIAQKMQQLQQGLQQLAATISPPPAPPDATPNTPLPPNLPAGGPGQGMAVPPGAPPVPPGPGG